MSDSYIDPNETQLYGKFAREQLKDVCIGLVPALDGAVAFAIAAQKKADADMKAVLDAQPAAVTLADGESALADARDALVRFGKHLESIKGHPVPVSAIFDEAPSVLARRRIVKLVAALEQVAAATEKHQAKIRDAKAWLDELRTAHKNVAAIERAQRSSKVEQAAVRPDVAAAREAWLGVYAANRALIEGVLRHAGKLQLLPLVFDDLAESHRVHGVSDEAAPPAPQPAPVG
jgi:hypothetical protein